jgi:hypothetical protein
MRPERTYVRRRAAAVVLLIVLFFVVEGISDFAGRGIRSPSTTPPGPQRGLAASGYAGRHARVAARPGRHPEAFRRRELRHLRLDLRGERRRRDRRTSRAGTRARR